MDTRLLRTLVLVVLLSLAAASEPVTLNSADQDGCDEHGAYRREGDVWSTDGHKCICSNRTNTCFPGGCIYKAKLYEDGVNWLDGLESCQCIGSQVLCTTGQDVPSSMILPGQDVPPSSIMLDDAEVSGIPAEAMEVIMNAINNGTNSEDVFPASIMLAPEVNINETAPVGRSGGLFDDYLDSPIMYNDHSFPSHHTSIHHGGLGSRGCQRHGRFYDNGRHWREGNRRCSCSRSSVHCGDELCWQGDKFYSRNQIFHIDNRVCRCDDSYTVLCFSSDHGFLDGCDHHGTYHRDGHLWSSGGQSCRCSNRKATCFQGGCIHNDNLYDHGRDWLEGVETCRCAHSKVSCGSGFCNHNGRHYENNKVWRNGLDSCRCQSSKVSCLRDVCWHLDNFYGAGEIWSWNGQSCRCDANLRVYCNNNLLRGCQHNGRFYDNGNIFRDNKRSCKCNNYRTSCTDDLCWRGDAFYSVNQVFYIGNSRCKCGHDYQIHCDRNLRSRRCSHNGRFYDDGFAWREGSRSCRCHNYNVDCDLDYCWDNDRYYEVGSLFDRGGRRCRCDHGLSLNCFDYDPYSSSSLHSGGCNYGGAFHANGKFWREGPQSCRCRNSRARCSNEFCSHGGRDYFYDDVWQSEGRRCRCIRHSHSRTAYCDDRHGLSPLRSGCSHNGRHYDDGFSWREASQACRCRSSFVTCRHDFCSHRGRDYFFDDVWEFEGTSCRCDHRRRDAYCDNHHGLNTRGCFHRGRSISHGKHWKEDGKGCRCLGSTVTCGLDLCFYGDDHYSIGHRWNSNGLNCRCGVGLSVYCNDQLLRGCDYGGAFHDEGKYWREGQQACRCRNFRARCTNDFCSHGGRDYFYDDHWTSEGRNCRCGHSRTAFCDHGLSHSGGNRCSYNGRFFDEGHYWREGSQACRCRYPSVSCTSDFCSHGGRDYFYDDVWDYEGSSCRCDRHSRLSNCGGHGLSPLRGDRCSFNGRFFDNDHYWREGSRACRCRSRFVTCTSDFCSHGGRDYFYDDHWRWENQHCRCNGHGRSAFCGDRHGISHLRGGRCSLNGRFFDDGHYWREGAEVCRCRFSSVGCSLDFCSHGGRDYFYDDDWEYEGQRCSCDRRSRFANCGVHHGLSPIRGNRCSYNGRFFDDGHYWREDLRACRCRSSSVTCTLDFCSHGGRDYFYDDDWVYEGQRCRCDRHSRLHNCGDHHGLFPSRGGRCSLNGRFFDDGRYWREGPEACRCRSSFVGCTLDFCSHGGRDYFYDDHWDFEGQRCSCDRRSRFANCGNHHGLSPIRGNRCSYNGRFFDDGHYWREGSQACRCRYPSVSCNSDFCSHGGRDYFYDDVWTFEGSSCRCDRHSVSSYNCDSYGLSPVRGSQCSYNGRFFDDNHYWREGSQACRCRSTRVTCTLDFCSHGGRDYFYDDDWVYEGQRCRCDRHSRLHNCDDYGLSPIRGNRCSLNGRFFDHGHSWREGSQACRCRFSNIRCSSDFCSHGGRDYFFDDIWDNNGRSCRCDHRLRTPNCDYDYGHSSGIGSCNYNGRFYDDGFTWSEGSQACRCSHASVHCRHDFCSHGGNFYFVDDVWDYDGTTCRCDYSRNAYCDDYGHSSGTCNYYGAFYEDGYSWREGFQACKCRRSSVTCSHEFCSHNGRDYFYDDVWEYEGSSCRCNQHNPHCDKHYAIPSSNGCHYHGESLDHGYSWREGSQLCKCSDSNVHCNYDFCSHGGKDHFIGDNWDFDGKSCSCNHGPSVYCDDHGSNSCRHGSNLYALGDTWAHEGRSCTCRDGYSIYCNDEILRGCTHKGTLYEEGKVWRSGQELCDCKDYWTTCKNDVRFCHDNFDCPWPCEEYYADDKDCMDCRDPSWWKTVKPEFLMKVFGKRNCTPIY